MRSQVNMTGKIYWKLYDENGNLKNEGESPNVITTQGLHYYVDQLSDKGGSAAALMLLGTGTADVAAADTWVGGFFANNGTTAGTAGGLAGNITTHASSANVLQYMGTFAAGYASENGISRVGIANMVASSDGNGTPNGTTTFFIAHGTIDPVVNKGESDTLVISWYHQYD
jgi:hypothetical protein